MYLVTVEHVYNGHSQAELTGHCIEVAIVWRFQIRVKSIDCCTVGIKNPDCGGGGYYRGLIVNGGLTVV